jgi:hypothetical protein
MIYAFGFAFKIRCDKTITEGGAAADADSGGAKMGHGAEHGAEGGAKQDAEAMHDERAERTGPAKKTPQMMWNAPWGLSMPLLRPTLPPKPLLQPLKTSFAHRLRK